MRGTRASWLLIIAFLEASSIFLSANAIPLLWKGSKEAKEKQEKVTPVIPPDQDYSHVELLKDQKCPAAEGQELNDYWRCLWRTSLTADGYAQEYVAERLQGYYGFDFKPPVEYEYPYLDALIEEWEIAKKKKAEEESKGFKKVNKIRKKRDMGNVSKNIMGRSNDDNVTANASVVEYNGVIIEIEAIQKEFERLKLESIDTNIDDDKVEFEKIVENAKANRLNLVKVGMRSWDTKVSLQNKDSRLICQRLTIDAGETFENYRNCLRESAPIQFERYIKLRSEQYEPPEETFNPSEYSVPRVDIRGAERLEPDSENERYYDLKFNFRRMKWGHGDDTWNHYDGADPYVVEQVGEYRYRYDNLRGNQKPPGWSNVGKNPSPQWHTLELKKFLIPLKDNVDLERYALETDLAQAFPGVAEVADVLTELKAPIDFNWHHNNGYNTFTRFAIPLLDENDLNYFQFKKVIPESVTERTPDDVLNEILSNLEDFIIDTEDPIDETHYNSIYNVTHFKAYTAFIKHYYDVDFSRVELELKAANRSTDVLFDDFDFVREALRSYLQVVIAAEACSKDMLEEFTYERPEGEEFLEQVLNTAKEKCPNTDENNYMNQTIESPRDVMRSENFTYNEEDFVTLPEHLRREVLRRAYHFYNPKLGEVYDDFFDRKEARQRFTLPSYPFEFPICKHNEPSPIDIITKNGRKSSLRDYQLSQEGYRLNRFYMMTNNDGSPLLSVGIHEGLRIDKSAVELTGGAVRGQVLSFQYMFFHYSSDWKLEGSEHRLDGKGAPMEIQLLFTIAGSSDYLKYWQVLARVQNQQFQFRGKFVHMLAFLVDVLETDEAVKEKIKETGSDQDPYMFEPFAQIAYRARKDWQGSRSSLGDLPRGYVSDEPTFRLYDFIPDVSTYYTYRGSLTWPPCFGYVLWSVFTNRYYISKRQFDHFARYPSFGLSNHNRLSDNIRRPEDIYVEEENNPSINYATREFLVKKRTVDRYILEGLQDVTDESLGFKLVDDIAYQATEENLAIMNTPPCPFIMGTGALIFSIYIHYYYYLL